MSKRYSSREILKALRRAGFHDVSQQGSHLKLRATRGNRTWTVIVKHPAAEVPAGTFKSILRQAGLTLDEFEHLLA
ncbi:MAG TPA: type II toxin-antitoxin system HicA family toxin [Ktedonobacterales bacterium]|nr:type II toxin-antitoxin system HicA family toxin [Ktedonobacterales bacterium]